MGGQAGMEQRPLGQVGGVTRERGTAPQRCLDRVQQGLTAFRFTPVHKSKAVIVWCAQHGLGHDGLDV